jgi:hypothetical protein
MARLPSTIERSPLFVEAVRTKHAGRCPTLNKSLAPPLAPVTEITVTPENTEQNEKWSIMAVGLRLAFEDASVFNNVLRGLRITIAVYDRSIVSIPAWFFLDERATIEVSDTLLQAKTPPLEVMALTAKTARDNVSSGFCRFFSLGNIPVANTPKGFVVFPHQSLRVLLSLDVDTYNSVLGYERAERPWQMGAGFIGYSEKDAQ